MNRKPAIPPLTGAALDRVLAADDSILPSSGFADAVMASVLHQTAAPAPLPFPWKRALPGLAAAVAAIVVLLAVIPSAVGAAFSSANRAPATLGTNILPASLSQLNSPALWITVSLVLALACLAFCRRLITVR